MLRVASSTLSATFENTLIPTQPAISSAIQRKRIRGLRRGGRWNRTRAGGALTGGGGGWGAAGGALAGGAATGVALAAAVASGSPAVTAAVRRRRGGAAGSGAGDAGRPLDPDRHSARVSSPISRPNAS